MIKRLLALGVFGVLAVGLWAAWGLAADKPKTAPAKEEEPFGDLVGALKKSPGCLGVETAETGSGKQVIFAWFENKKAALDWYHSDTHMQLVKMFPGGGMPGYKPLASIPEDSGPLMAVASVTMTKKPTKDNPLPFRQIAIEMYQPMPGGLAIGGRFTPEGVKVKRKPAKAG